MDMNLVFLCACAAGVALALGLLIGWLIWHGRTASAVATAVAEAKSTGQAEVATLTERSTSLAAALAEERQQHAETQRSLDASRTLLDTATNDIARLTERSSRVPDLEAQVVTLKANLSARESELRDVSITNGQHAERAVQLRGQLEEVTSGLEDVKQQLKVKTEALQASVEARAALEEQVRRLPLIDSELSALQSTLERREAELRALSATNGQNAERAMQQAQQLEDVNKVLTETQRRLQVVTDTLREVSQSRAAFEQDAMRVPGLEQQLADTSARLANARDDLSALRESTSAEIARLSAELVAGNEALAQARQEGSSARTAAATAEKRVADLSTELTELRTRTDDERSHSAEKLTMLMQARDELSAQFKTLANEILEEKSRRFAEQNQTTLSQLLDPLRSQLFEFKGKVEEVYVQEGKDRTALSEQVRQLVQLNQTLSDDAKNLTRALKGQAKTQGNWGELILERVLEASGLRKGHEYKVQDSQTREDGTRAQPDVVIELPEDRKLIVDAKVSLVAYERFVAADNEEERAIALRQHLSSVREHIKGLSDKNYHLLYGLQSLDFVLAFVPVEPAFMMAVSNDNELFMDAWQRNVLLVSPSTLLFVVRTVAHLWRQEAQNRNAQEIAKRGAQLYDKLVGFVEDLQKVGERLSQAKSSYDLAHSKLVGGNGNVVRQAELLRSLGVKPTKALPKGLVDAAGSDEAFALPEATQTAVLIAPGNDRGTTAAPAGPSLSA